MQKPSDEELVNIVMKLGLDGCRDFTSDELKTDLLFRLERGRKAIEAMGKVINCRETFLKSEMSVLGDLDMAADSVANSIHKIIEGYQQSCKEAADEN